MSMKELNAAFRTTVSYSRTRCLRYILTETAQTFARRPDEWGEVKGHCDPGYRTFSDNCGMETQGVLASCHLSPRRRECAASVQDFIYSAWNFLQMFHSKNLTGEETDWAVGRLDSLCLYCGWGGRTTYVAPRKTANIPMTQRRRGQQKSPAGKQYYGG